MSTFIDLCVYFPAWTNLIYYDWSVINKETFFTKCGFIFWHHCSKQRWPPYFCIILKKAAASWEEKRKAGWDGVFLLSNNLFKVKLTSVCQKEVSFDLSRPQAFPAILASGAFRLWHEVTQPDCLVWWTPAWLPGKVLLVKRHLKLHLQAGVVAVTVVWTAQKTNYE